VRLIQIQLDIVNLARNQPGFEFRLAFIDDPLFLIWADPKFMDLAGSRLNPI